MLQGERNESYKWKIRPIHNYEIITGMNRTYTIAERTNNNSDAEEQEQQEGEKHKKRRSSGTKERSK